MPRLPVSRGRRVAVAWIALASMILLIGCSGGDGEGSDVDPADADVSISANDLKFSTDRLEAPAGEAFTLAFTNEEGAPHNVAIYREQGGESLFVGDVINGPDRSVVYDIPALEPGEYYFQCDLHPDMNGTLVVG